MTTLHLALQFVCFAGVLFLLYNLVFTMTIRRGLLWLAAFVCTLLIVEMVAPSAGLNVLFAFCLAVSLLYLRMPLLDRVLSFSFIGCGITFANQVLLFPVILISGDLVQDRLDNVWYWLAADLLILILLSAMIRTFRTRQITFVPGRGMMLALTLLSLIFTAQLILIERTVPTGDIYKSWILALSYMVGGILCILLTFASSSRRRAASNNVELQRYIDTMGMYLRESAERDEEFRHFRHDVRHHIGVLENLARGGDADRMLEYIQEFNKEIPGAPAEQIRSGNRIMNALLFEARLKAKAVGVDVEVKGTLCEPFFVADYDLCTIVSNLVDNAIEYEAAHDMNRVSVKMATDVGSAVIEVRNQVEEGLNAEQVIRSTSKQDKEIHGFGISNVRRAVAKNKGEITFSRDGDEFVAQVTLYDPSRKIN